MAKQAARHEVDDARRFTRGLLTGEIDIGPLDISVEKRRIEALDKERAVTRGG